MKQVGVLILSLIFIQCTHSDNQQSTYALDDASAQQFNSLLQKYDTAQYWQNAPASEIPVAYDFRYLGCLVDTSKTIYEVYTDFSLIPVASGNRGVIHLVFASSSDTTFYRYDDADDLPIALDQSNNALVFSEKGKYVLQEFDALRPVYCGSTGCFESAGENEVPPVFERRDWSKAVMMDPIR